MPKQQFSTRPWRALHDLWLSSDRLALASSDAIVLFLMLVTKQSDSGRFPWSPMRVRSLTSIRDWSFNSATKIRDELVSLGVVSVDGSWVTLRRGNELNGTPSSGGKDWILPRYYPGEDLVITQLGPGTKPALPRLQSTSLPDVLNTSQVDARDVLEPEVFSQPLVTQEGGGYATNSSPNSVITQLGLNQDCFVPKPNLREPNLVEPNLVTVAPLPKNKKRPHLTEHETSELHSEYDAALTTERVTSEIAASLDHEAAYKRGKSGSRKLYVQAWLRRSVAPTAAVRPAPPSSNGSSPPPMNVYEAERQRIAKLGVAKRADA